MAKKLENNAVWFDSWQVYTKGICGLISAQNFDPSETVWRGADGSYIVGDVDGEMEEEMNCEYTDTGTVQQFLDDCDNE